ncbi:MAG TPA: alpha/beta hydrolase-fold protein, partial [Chthoniobacterales bacterium]
MVARLLAFFCLVVGATAFARSPHKEPVTFSYTGDVGFGNSVFVVGNHPDVGSWDVTHAVKLRFTPGNVWTGTIAIQAGTELQYRYIKRKTAAASWCDSTNGSRDEDQLSGTVTLTTAAQPSAPYAGKTIYYLSGWSSAAVIFSSNGGSFTGATMAKIGSGRAAGESLYKISGIGEAGASLQFVFTDGNGNYDKAPGGADYFTELDVFEVQDGNVFSYQPPATVSPPQIITHFVDSTAPNIPGRTVRVYLPRGYEQNTTHRYPVLYLHDGQNVFDPGGPYGSWSADATATREIGQGRMRETIMVGIDNTDNRIAEYLPPGDSYKGSQGISDAYASFVINNVRPYIDNTFRTLNDFKNTLTLGSSLGGLVSVYLGREFSVFGKIGVLSPAFWAAPNYIGHVVAGSKIPIRVYLDFGTLETASDWDKCVSMFDLHLAQGYAANDDVTFVAGCNQEHNEAAWAARLRGTLHYLLPAGEAPNELAGRDYPPLLAIAGLNVATQSAHFV